MKESKAKKIGNKLIGGQISLLGPEIALAKARSVKSIEIDVNGEIIKFHKRPRDALQKLIGVYVSLTGLDVVKKILGSSLDEFPDISLVEY